MHSDEHHAHAHPTGHRWLDIILGLGAIFISVVSLFVAIEDSRAMRNMAEQNARLVTANSWPFLQWRTHNITADEKEQISISLVNTGVGPARIRSLEMWWRGKPMPGSTALLEVCCGYTAPPPHVAPNDLRHMVNWAVYPAIGHVLRPGENVDILKMDDNKANAAVYAKLDAERQNLTFRACFCSVFDECRVSPLIGVDATRVKSCPKPAVMYGYAPPAVPR